MDFENEEELKKIRLFIYKYGLKNSSIEDAEKNGIDATNVLLKYGSLSNLVEQLLAYERASFEQIFKDTDFENMNAIDILLIVGQEINKRFHYLSPGTTLGLKKQFPTIYEKHIQERLAYIYDKVKKNIEKGIAQKIYKKDISVEMMARLYISKLNEIHDPEIYPASEFTFSTVFSRLIDQFIRTNANEDGLQYYKQRKQLYTVLNFGH
ncbi:TetR family transcriptional regulator [Balneicella halophila]|uniref:TetR family transcriptional regulator n=1 Tax=Balneicella halophila TaxID=1537566 RepID=A0A7L4UR59_BALHA|nr:hypothetical protein [Balneicella halophila]PVX50789.1 TetR family transcriptional regulator [Balneicella halophila]